MKKLITYLILCICTALIHSQDAPLYDEYIVSGDTFIAKNKKIDLSSAIEEINNELAQPTYIETIPFSIDYFYKELSLFIFTDNNTDEVKSVFVFLSEKGKPCNTYLNIDGLEIVPGTDWDELEQILIDNNIEYSLEKSSYTHSFILKDHRVLSFQYYKDDITHPYSVQFSRQGVFH